MNAYSRLIALAAVFSSVAQPGFGAEPQLPRAVGLQAVTALFVEDDLEEFKKHVHGQAKCKNGDVGSLLKSLEHQSKRALGRFSLDRVVFFDEKTLDSVAKEYPSELWKTFREQENLKDKLGCLAVLVPKDEGKHVGLMAFVIDEIEGTPLIVYSEDN